MLLLCQGWGEGDWAGDRTGTILRNSLHRVFTNRVFSHTPPHPLVATLAVRCNCVAVDVCCSLFKPATRRPPPSVDHRAQSTADFWAHANNCRPNVAPTFHLRDDSPRAYTDTKTTNWVDSLCRPQVAGFAFTHTCSTNDCANHQAARALSRNLGHTV